MSAFPEIIETSIYLLEGLPMKELLAMSRKEIDRVGMLQRVVAEELSQVDAARALSVTDRHLRRILVRFRTGGPAGLTHRSRGKPSNNRLEVGLKNKAITLVKNKYSDFGPTLASEKLEEIDGIKIGREILRQAMTLEGIWKPKRRRKQHREWRERKECVGEMVQFDGSHHDWFEGRAGSDKCVLLASRDDASNEVCAVFTEAEDVTGVLTFWKAYLEDKGKPVSIYLDRGSTYKVNHKSALDEKMLTQFERATEELDIRIIHANSPQAKGRIENLFNTLQDRLVKELRLRYIGNKDEANRFLQEKFLPRFNQRFKKEPRSRANLHRALTKADDLSAILSVKSTRFINNDFTIRFKCKWHQLERVQPTLVTPKMKVIIEERLDQTLHLKMKNQSLSFHEIPKPMKEQKPATFALTSNPIYRDLPQMARTPRTKHPWKTYQPALARH